MIQKWSLRQLGWLVEVCHESFALTALHAPSLLILLKSSISRESRRDVVLGEWLSADAQAVALWIVGCHGTWPLRAARRIGESLWHTHRLIVPILIVQLFLADVLDELVLLILLSLVVLVELESALLGHSGHPLS